MPVSSLLSLCAVQAFWLGLLIPGLALLERSGRAALEDGALAVIARAYLVSFALLTPWSVLGQLLRWPLWTLSSAYLLCVALGLWSLAARLRRLPRWQWPGTAAALGCTVLLIELWLGARAGTHTAGDAGYHIARVRSMLSIGMNSLDPLVDNGWFDAVYPVNLFHALLASCAQLTHNDPGLVWLATWPFAKLLVASGAYTLGCAVFRQRWLAWTATVATLCWHATYSVMPFPNTLAPSALLPLGFAAAIEALQRPHSYRGALWLGLTSLALGQWHNLNAFFLVITVAPVLGAALLYRVVRRRGGQRQLLAALLALACAGPWLLVQALPRLEALVGVAGTASREAPKAPVASAEPAAASPAADGGALEEDRTPVLRGPKSNQFTRRAGGKLALEPMQLAGPSGRNLPAAYALLAALVLCWRARLWAFASLMAMTAAWLTVPTLCTLLLSAISAAWAVLRMNSLLTIGASIALPALPLLLVQRLPRVRQFAVARVALELIGIVGAYFYGRQFGQHADPWTQVQYLAAAQSGRSLRVAHEIEARRDFFARNVPSGATVMAATRWDYNLPMHHDCRAFCVAPGRGWHGMDDIPQRQALIDEFYAKRTSGERRLEILRMYRIAHVYASRRAGWQIAAGLKDHVLNVDATPHGALLTIRL